MSTIIIITPPPTKPPGSGTLAVDEAAEALWLEEAHQLLDEAHQLLDEAAVAGARIKIVHTEE